MKSSDSWWHVPTAYDDLYLGARWEVHGNARRKLHAVDWRGKAVEILHWYVTTLLDMSGGNVIGENDLR